MKKIDYKKHLIQLLYVLIGVFLMDIGFYFFFKPSGIVGGGIGGIAIICDPFLHNIHLSTSIFLYILEGICLLLALIFVGVEFFLKTVYASVLAPTFIFIFEVCNIPPDFFYKAMANQLLVASILGAIFQGVGVGIALSSNASTGGIDSIQKILNKYLKIPYSVTMYTTDLIIVFLSGFNFLTGGFNLEYVFFGFVSVFLCSYTVDLITLRAFGKKTAYILTLKEQEVKQFLKAKFNRKTTSLHVKLEEEQDKEYTLIICVLKKLEAYKLRDAILDLDPDSFTFFIPTKELIGKYDERTILSKIFNKSKTEIPSSDQ